MMTILNSNGKFFIQTIVWKKEVRILIIGLDAAGKTSTLYTLKLGEVVTTIPTIGFNVETVDYKNVSMTVWDVGGRSKIRPLYRHYYQNTQGLVYVIDSNDRERLGEAFEELWSTASEDELRNVPIMVLANKQDLPNAMTPQEIAEKLQEKGRFHGRNWNVFGVCAVDKENNGLYEAFEWLADQIHRNERNTFASYLIQGNKEAATAETVKMPVKSERNEKSVLKESEQSKKPFYTSLLESFKKMIV